MGGAAVRAVALACLALAACGPSDMAEQERIEPFEVHGALVPPEGTMPRDALGRAVELAVQPAADAELLARGADRYAIFCAPCHGIRADGHGRIPSVPSPPDLLASPRDAASMVRVIT
ncbi:MAG: cytochrome c, partial [Pseudomonadota bacterium]